MKAENVIEASHVLQRLQFLNKALADLDEAGDRGGAHAIPKSIGIAGFNNVTLSVSFHDWKALLTAERDRERAKAVALGVEFPPE